MRNKILSLLVLLMTAASGAWAQTQITQDFENGLGDWTMANCHSSSRVTNTYTPTHSGTNMFRFYYNSTPQYLISPEIDAAGGGTMSFYYARYSNSYTERFKVGYSTTTNDPTAFTWGIEETCTNTFSSAGYLEYTYDIPAGAKYVAIACTSPDQFYFFIDDIKIEYAAAADPNAVEVTTNKAQGETTFTEATFKMPTFDATAEYELVRDLATSTKVDLIIGTGSDAVTATADTRLRIAKSNNVYAPISALSCNFVDQIENTTIAATAFADAKLTPQFYLQGENDAWTLVTDINTTTHLPNNLLPGQVYRLTLKAADGSYYDGETQPSYTVTLFEGYEVTIPAGEYITYYRDEPLKLDDADKETIELYTISAVGTETATLSGPYDAMKALTPMLVHNKNTEEAKTILLIPCNEPDLALTVAPEFKGTLVATEIAASSATSNNYAFNGKQFVWVKSALAIGANKAWLEVPVSTSNARTVTLVFDNTTRIDGANISDALDGDYYDLNGRKLQGKPTKKGIYIKNGRKVVVK